MKSDHKKMTGETSYGAERFLFYGVCALFFFSAGFNISPVYSRLVLGIWVLSGRFVKDAGLVLNKLGWPVLAPWPNRPTWQPELKKIASRSLLKKYFFCPVFLSAFLIKIIWDA